MKTKISILLLLLLMGVSKSMAQYQLTGEISSFTQSTPQPAYIYSPGAMAHDASGNLFTVDYMRDQIVKVNSSGNYAARWDFQGAPIVIDGIEDLTVDLSGNVFAISAPLNKVVKYSNNGVYVTEWGMTGSGNGQFNSLIRIVADNNGYIYAQDGGRIQKFNSSGSFVNSWSNTANDITVDATGNIYSIGSTLIKYNSSGTLLNQWSITGNRVEVDGTGNIYTVSPTLISKYNSSGIFISQWTTLSNNSKLSIHPITGDFYESDQNTGNMRRTNSSGTVINSWNTRTSATYTDAPEGIAIDGSGNVYVVDVTNSNVQKYNSSGTFLLSWGNSGTGNGQLNNPSDIAIDGNGFVYVVDKGNNRIQKFTSNGVFDTKWGTLGSGNGQFNAPSGIDIDASGFVYVADAGNHRIQKFTSTGVYNNKWGGTASSATGQFNGPTDIAIDASGNIFVADAVNGRIQKLTSAGTYITHVSGTTKYLAIDGSGKVYSSTGTNQVNVYSNSLSPASYSLSLQSVGVGNPVIKGIDIDLTEKIFLAEILTKRICIYTLINPEINIQRTGGINVTSGGSYNFCIASMQGTGKSIDFTIQNLNLNSPLAITGTVLISGTNASEFTVNQTNVPSSIPGGGSAIFTITFMPTAQGVRSATLLIPNNDSDENPYLIYLNGTGSNSALAIINGPNAVCAGSNVNYSISNPLAGYTYTWTLPPASTIVSGHNTSAINANMGGGSGDLTVTEISGACPGYTYVKPITIYNSNQTTTSSITGPTNICSGQNLTYSVSNHVGSTYAWTVPSGVSITSGQGTNSINVTSNTNVQSGNISVSETSVCGVNAPVMLPIVSRSYKLADASVFCGGSGNFCVSLRSEGLMPSGIIGLDYALTYDITKVSPTGTASTGPVATAYGTYALNTSTPGTVYVSVYLNSAPAGTYFSGTGEIICIQFQKLGGFTFNSTTAVTCGIIEESLPLGTASVCGGGTSTISYTGSYNGQLIYRSNGTNKITGGVTELRTDISGYNNTCTPIGSFTSQPDVNGIFGFNVSGSTQAIGISRDVPGDVNVPSLNCSNVQASINSMDRIMAIQISNHTISSPTVYQLLAADVNRDGKVTAGDATLISSRSINAGYCEFPQVSNYTWNGTTYLPSSNYQPSKDWLFIDQTTINSPTFTTGMSRNVVPVVPACMVVPQNNPAVCNASINETFQGILLGDVDGNWLNSSHASNAKGTNTISVIIDLNKTELISSGVYAVPVYYEGVTTLQGLDFSIDYDGTQLQISGLNTTVLNDWEAVWNNISGEKFLANSYSVSGIQSSEAVLYLVVHTSKDEISENELGNIEAYVNGEAAHVKTSKSSGTASTMASASPNPFSEHTSIHVSGASGEFFEATLFDMQGKTVEQFTLAANTPMEVGQNIPSGMYFMQVKIGEEVQTIKIVKQ